MVGLFETHSDVEVFLENLTETRLKSYSHDAVLDLFNFCIVLYVRWRYFLDFTFAILGFVLLAKRREKQLMTTFGNHETIWGEVYHSFSVSRGVSSQLDCIRSVLRCLHLLK